MSATDLAADRELLGRTSTAEKVADILRTRISEGYFAPGTRLSEESIGASLNVSRNTLREAFRLLTHERLLVHELNRGVFVRRLELDDVIDLYRVRILLECAAVRDLKTVPEGLDGLAGALVEGEVAASRADWQAVGTANIHFHQAIVGLAGSTRLDEVMNGIHAELRLAFHVVTDLRAFHEPFLAGNGEILERLVVGDGPGAARLLADYLHEAELRLTEVYRALD